MNRREAFQSIIAATIGCSSVNITELKKELSDVEKVAAKYLFEVAIYLQHVDPADERFMRSIENRVDVAEQNCDDFRRHIMCQIGILYFEHKPVTWDFNPILAKAFQEELESISS